MSLNERRRHPRFPFSSQPWVFSLQWKEPARGDRALRVEARNISRCGLKFFCNQKIVLFEQMHLILLSKNEGKELARLEGKVVRLEEIDTGLGEKTYGIALDFTSGVEALQKLLPDRDLGTNDSGT